SPGSYGSFGEGGKGFPDDEKGIAPDAKHLKHGGDMQLEDLKKYVTPEMLKKLNITDQEWQRFQRDPAAYEEALRRQHVKSGKNTTELKGTTSLIAGQRPREIAGNKNAPMDPLQSGVGLPPPEFREPQRLFNTRQQPKGP